MKHTRFYISIYIIIPAIFAGISFLSAIVAFRITDAWYRPEEPLAQDKKNDIDIKAFKSYKI